MPLIEGKKMACAPCIRGHRSSKCAHHDRLMIEVRKPGRPLSVCPHKGECSCGKVTAAIPKRQNCACPSHKSESMPIKSEPDLPLSPTSKTSFRVQKSGSKVNSRKQSYDPSSLGPTFGRMDVNNINVMTTYNSLTPFTTHYDTIPPNGTPTYSNGFSVGSGPESGFPVRSAAAQQATGSDVQSRPSVNTTFSASDSLVESPTASTTATSRTSSCCSGVSSVAQHTPTSSSGSISLEAAAIPKANSSCCGPKTEHDDAQSQITYRGQPPLSNGSSVMQHYPPSVGIHQHIYAPNYAQTIYTYPASYGTYANPLQSSQWQQMTALGFQPAPVSQPYAMQQAAPVEQNAQGGTIHECACGPGCSCIGCAAHPYNTATQDYVKETWQWQSQEDILTSSETFGTITNNPARPLTDGDSPITAPGSDTASSGPSISTEGQVDDFLWVGYQYPGCDGLEDSCPCGDDCSCFGCVVHGNNNRVSSVE
ncbi:hypothetical protein BJ170DRAFT_276406 [Xylariales sp. AK1849]|nr:hypothetical protein BJ170DRAFT_276406 [Xylariales sp. AK1849]